MSGIKRSIIKRGKKIRFIGDTAGYLWAKKNLKNLGIDRWEEVIRKDETLWDEAVHPGKEKRKVLFATSVGHYYSGTALESLVAAALILRGFEVHVLLCDSFLPICQVCSIYLQEDLKEFIKEGPARNICVGCFVSGKMLFEEVGVKVHRYSDYISKDQSERASKIAAELPASEIPRYKEDGINIGEHAVAGALRFYGNGTLAQEPDGEAILRRYLDASLRSYYVAVNLAQRYQFDCVVLHHGIYVPQGVLCETFRKNKTRVATWIQSYRSKTFIFSHDDTFHHTLISEETSRWENMKWSETIGKELMDYLGSRRCGTHDWISFMRDPVDQELRIDLSRPAVGLLTNVMWDAQLHYPANAFKNMLDWVLKTIRYFAARPELQLVIRVHPAEISGFIPSRQPITGEIRNVFPELPENIIIIPPESRVSTYDLMDKCDAFIIYGTKTGVELSARGIPVIVAGEAWIRNKGITIDASSEEAYFKILDRLPIKERLSEETTLRAMKYAYHFFFRRMIPVEYVEPTGMDNTPYRISLESLKDLLPGRSRGLDAICNGIASGADFIYKAEEY